jgi:hypothetical protein
MMTESKKVKTKRTVWKIDDVRQTFSRADAPASHSRKSMSARPKFPHSRRKLVFHIDEIALSDLSMAFRA